jgi:hypothetical protein
LARSFAASLKSSQKQKKYETDARYLQYNKQGFFINTLTKPLPKCFLSPLDLPVSTSELSASTTLRRYKDLVQHKYQFQVQQQQQLLLDNQHELQ